MSESAVIKLFLRYSGAAILFATESVNRFEIELQPLLMELCDIRPTPQQFAKLYKELTLFTQDMELDDETAKEISGLSVQDKQDATRTVSKIFSEPENWEQVLARTLQSAKNSHPIFANAIIFLLSAIFAIVLNIAANIMYDTIKTAKLYKAPSANSPVIITIIPVQQVIVIGEAPYYFKIEYADPETGETYTGWVSKRAIQEHEKFSEEEIEDTSDQQ